MNMNDLFNQLQSAGVKVAYDQGRLDLKLPKDLDPQLKAKLIEHKDSFKLFLQSMFKSSDSKIQPVARNNQPMVTSYSQQRLWFMDQLQGGSPEYNMPVVLNVHGPLDVALLDRVFSQIIARHEVLRTVYVEHDGEAMQQIVPMSQIDFSIEVQDLRQFSGQALDQQVKHYVDTGVVKPFDLAEDLMLRVSYLMTGDDAGVLVFNMHHIASDGWSMEVLNKEFFTLYDAFSRGLDNPLPDLAIQYADYAAWQRTHVAAEALEQQLDYWQKQLAEVPAVHGLPLSFARPDEKLHQGAIVRGSLSTKVSEALLALATKYQLTPFMLLHGALSLLLARHSNSSDIVIGTPVANRTQEQLTPLIGFFVNTLVLRANTDHHSIDDYFKHIRQLHMDAQANQDVPFEQLVDRLKIPRRTNHSPLFQIMMATNTQYGVDGHSNSEQTEQATTTFERFKADKIQSKFDLELGFNLHDNGINISWLYDVSLFSQQDISRLNDHLCRLLTALSAISEGDVSNEQMQLSQLPILSPQESQHLLIELNDNVTDYAKDQAIHQLFEAKVAVHPEQLALVFDKTEVSYQALNQQTNQLAHYLIAQGITQGDFVAVCMERSVEFVVAILAILKAGGAYMPLDPTNPPSRLNYMVADAKPKLMLASQAHVAAVAHMSLPQLVLNTAQTQQLLQSFADTNPELAVSPNDLAYVIYTSGSTGEPKGVLIEQRSVVQLVSGQHYYQAGVGDVIGFCANPAFDAATWELWGSLLHGAQLLVITNTMLLNGQALKAYLLEHKVNILHLTVGLFNQHAQVLMDFYPKLDYLLFGGEKADASKVREVLNGQMPKHLVQCYGPTETTTFASTQLIESLADDALTVPIGKPLTNTQIYILNNQLQPLPQGCEGELYIGGDGLARGYLNQDELTKRSFIDNPFYDANNPSSSKRLYKSGDLARILADGSIEYIGRRDQQVKVRGLRIELGEVESQLEKLDTVDSAKVVTTKTAEQESKLCAYVRLKDEHLQHDSFEQEISSWNSLFSQTYEKSEVNQQTQTDTQLNTAGWVSSFTGDAYTSAQMQTWADETVERIRALAPKKILEIGCGTGMLLLQYGHFCQQVYAVDISESAVRQVQRAADANNWSHVHLAVGDAYSIADLDVNDFDLIVINSVAQYFPSESYFNQVIDLSIAKLSAQGNIFVGDVRNFDTLNLFAKRVVWEKRQADWSVDEFSRRVSKRQREEKELLFSPDYFQQLTASKPELAGFDVWLKDAIDDNEMSAFRYDVILRTSANADQQSIAWLPDLAQLEQAMQQSNAQVYGLRAVTNPNLLLSQRIDHLVEQQQFATDALNQELLPSAAGIGFDALQQLCTAHGYAIARRFSQADDYLMDCVIYPHTTALNSIASLDSCPSLADGTDTSIKPQLFNKPYLHTIAARLIPILKKSLQGALPSYMLPNHFELIDEWPLTANGKLNVKALPAPDDIALQGEYIAPQTEIEQVLVTICADLLNIEAEKISVSANFFDLGGHSLMIIRLLNKIKQQLGLSMDVQALYQVNDIQALAQICESIQSKMQLAERLAQHDDSELEEVEF